MTIEAIPGLTEFLPTLPGLPLMKTKGLTPTATTVRTRPLAVTLRVWLTDGLLTVGVGVGAMVGFTVGVGVGLLLGKGVGDGVDFALTVRVAWTVLDWE